MKIVTLLVVLVIIAAPLQDWHSAIVTEDTEMYSIYTDARVSIPAGEIVFIKDCTPVRCSVRYSPYESIYLYGYLPREVLSQ